MKEIIEFIEKQFDYNRNRNLFYSEIYSSMNFAPELPLILKRIETLNEETKKTIHLY